MWGRTVQVLIHKRIYFLHFFGKIGHSKKRINLTWGFIENEKNNPTLFILSLFLLQGVQAAEYRKIEVFDMGKGKTIQKIESGRKIQQQVYAILDSIDGVYKGIRLDFKKGQIYKVPIEPVVHVENQWFSGLVTEVYLIKPDTGTPVLLLIDDENKGYYMHFKKDIQSFLHTLPLLKEDSHDFPKKS